MKKQAWPLRMRKLTGPESGELSFLAPTSGRGSPAMESRVTQTDKEVICDKNRQINYDKHPRDLFLDDALIRRCMQQ